MVSAAPLALSWVLAAAGPSPTTTEPGPTSEASPPTTERAWLGKTGAATLGSFIGLPRGMTTIGIRAAAGYFVIDGLELGAELSDTLLVWNTTLTNQLQELNMRAPTQAVGLMATVRYVPLRRSGFSAYLFAGLGPTILNRGGTVIAHVFLAPGALIRLGGRVHLNLGFRFSQAFPLASCEQAFVGDGEQNVPAHSFCEYGFGPSVGVTFMLGK